MSNLRSQDIFIYTRNAAFQKLEVLKTNRQKRARYGQFLVEGVRSINEAVRQGWPIAAFVYPGDRPLSAWAQGLLATVKTQGNISIENGLFAELSSKTDPSELLAVVEMAFPSPEIKGEAPLIVVFDRPGNKGNLGTLIRSCEALGASALFITGHSVDPYDNEVITASRGAFFRLPPQRVENNAEWEAIFTRWRQRWPGLLVAATTAHRQTALYEADFIRPTVLLIGNETDGLNAFLYSMADLQVTIPFAPGACSTSLNVACAATVLLYEVNRQRSGKEAL